MGKIYKTNKMGKPDTMKTKETRRYDSIDGLRSFAAFGILMMHVRALGGYDISGAAYQKVIPSFTYLVFLFMMVSAFSMCCGYYEKIQNNQISVNEFYGKRYERIWPFFAMMVLLELLLDFRPATLAEAFADLTLVFSLLPNGELSVIGVGWTIGIIFLFYMLFPFFCFLLKEKKRAWFVFVIALVYQILCVLYFMDETHVAEGFRNRTNFLYCAVYFVAGGLLYLYRTEIGKLAAHFRWLLLALCAMVTAAYFFVPLPEAYQGLWYVVLFALWMMYAIGTSGKVLNNRATKFISSISMEIYLCHFGIFHVLKQLHLIHLFGKGLLSYVTTVLLVFAASAVFAFCVKWGIKRLLLWRKENKKRRTN